MTHDYEELTIKPEGGVLYESGKMQNKPSSKDLSSALGLIAGYSGGTAQTSKAPWKGVPSASQVVVSGRNFGE